MEQPTEEQQLETIEKFLADRVTGGLNILHQFGLHMMNPAEMKLFPFSPDQRRAIFETLLKYGRMFAD